jgi:PTH1 family peptidyl-tRNA hydrolase
VNWVVGLGNPGPKYAETRHNAGFLVLDRYVERHAERWRRGRGGVYANVGALKLFKPHSFMNRSGVATQAFMNRNRLKPSGLLVVHDDMDLPLGRLRLKRGGGAGGQKGVADISRAIGADYLRLKVGIGRPPEGWPVDRWVLSKFRSDEQNTLTSVLDRAAEGIGLIASDGAELAANQLNTAPS